MNIVVSCKTDPDGPEEVSILIVDEGKRGVRKRNWLTSSMTWDNYAIEGRPSLLQEKFPEGWLLSGTIRG